MNPRIIINALLCVLASCGGSGGRLAADAGGPSRGREPVVDAVMGDLVDSTIGPLWDAAVDRMVDAVRDRMGADSVDVAALDLVDLSRPDVTVDRIAVVDASKMPMCIANRKDGTHAAVSWQTIGGVDYVCEQGSNVQRAAEPVLPCLLMDSGGTMFLVRAWSADAGSGCDQGFEAFQ